MKASKPLLPPYPRVLKTLGDHLKKKRLDSGLLQRQVAQQVGVDEATIHNWETNRTAPALGFIPNVIKFLGYFPEDSEPRTLGQKLSTCRRLLGLSQKALARRLGVDPGTLARWEKGKGQPTKKFLTNITAFFTSILSKFKAPGE